MRPNSGRAHLKLKLTYEERPPAHYHGALRQLVVVLLNSFEVVPYRTSLANCSRGEVHYLVTVAAYGQGHQTLQRYNSELSSGKT